MKMGVRLNAATKQKFVAGGENYVRLLARPPRAGPDLRDDEEGAARSRERQRQSAEVKKGK